MLLTFILDLLEVVLVSLFLPIVSFACLLRHVLSLVEEVLAVLHEVHFLQKEVGLLLAVALLCEHASRRLLQLVVGPLDLLDVDFLLLYYNVRFEKNWGGTYLIHFNKPLVHELLLAWLHGSQRVKELTIPHDGGVHDHFVNH